MYVPRARHNLNQRTVKREGDNQVNYCLLERRDKNLNEIGWCRIHEFVRCPDQSNGLGRKECQELGLSILDNLMKSTTQHPGIYDGEAKTYIRIGR